MMAQRPGKWTVCQNTRHGGRPLQIVAQALSTKFQNVQGFAIRQVCCAVAHTYILVFIRRWSNATTTTAHMTICQIFHSSHQHLYVLAA
jgi:hypothetical protein